MVLPDPSLGGLIFHHKFVFEQISGRFEGRSYFAENDNNNKHHILKVLRMGHSIAENDRTTRETLLQNWRASQRPYGERKK